MKKKLEAELLSIAHRVLRLKNKDDIGQLQQEALRLYEKLSILKFVEENLGNPDKAEAKAIAEQKLEEAYEAPVTPTVQPVVAETPKVDEVEYEVQEVKVHEAEKEEETTKEVAKPEQEEKKVQVQAEEPIKEEAKQEARQEVAEEPKEQVKEEAKQETYGHDIVFDKKEPEQEKPVTQTEDLFEAFKNYKEPEFVKVDNDVPDVVPTSEDWQSWVPKTDEEETPATLTNEQSEQEEEKPVDMPVTPPVSTPSPAASFAPKTGQRSLNDALGKSINLGLNDRIAFEKHLFAGSSEDLNRVLSQLNTFDNFEDAQNFVNALIKPDYNNWDGKEEYEERFMLLVEKKFD